MHVLSFTSSMIIPYSVSYASCASFSLISFLHPHSPTYQKQYFLPLFEFALYFHHQIYLPDRLRSKHIPIVIDSLKILKARMDQGHILDNMLWQIKWWCIKCPVSQRKREHIWYNEPMRKDDFLQYLANIICIYITYTKFVLKKWNNWVKYLETKTFPATFSIQTYSFKVSINSR